MTLVRLHVLYIHGVWPEGFYWTSDADSPNKYKMYSWFRVWDIYELGWRVNIFGVWTEYGIGCHWIS